MSRSPAVTIVILNWNNAPDTITCLKSISALDYPNYTVLVVDNGSTDHSVSQIQAQYPTVDILETGENLGYAEGNNVGIRQAMQTNADYILVLNNDTYVAPDMLTRLIDILEAQPDVGIVGPKMYYFDDPKRIYAAGSVVDWVAGIEHHLQMNQLDQQTQASASPFEVDFIVGCGICIKRACLETIGLLNPDFYLEREDVDWCLRAKQAGFKVLLIPQAHLWHKVSATLGQGSPSATYYMTRNGILLYSMHLRGWRRILTLSRYLGRTVRTIGAWTLKSKYRHLYRHRSANLLALRDAFMGRYGPMGTDVRYRISRT